MAHPRRFPGGVHPREGLHGKDSTAKKPVVTLPVPDFLILPLSQHIGAACKPVVQKGDEINLGQLVGEAQGVVSAPIHATASGKVIDIVPCMLANGLSVPSVLIDNDHEDRWDPGIQPDHQIDTRLPEDLVERIRQAGIVGLGGATFPTSVKLTIPEGKQADILIVNGAECEPYLTADHRLMLEAPDALLDGIQLTMKALAVRRAIVGIEENKADAIALLQSKAPEEIKVVGLPVWYPQGGEKQLIYALTGRRVPNGQLPVSVGAVVINVATAVAIAHALRTGRPLVERIVTVAGRVRNPQNLRVRLGTTLDHLVEACGGLLEGAEKMVLGGPMMGMALSRLEIPVTKGSSGLLALGQESLPPEETPCIRCGRCVRRCPMQLQPLTMDAYIRKRMWAEAEQAGVMNCIECGACTFACPAKRQITQICRMGKSRIQIERSKQKGRGGKS